MEKGERVVAIFKILSRLSTEKPKSDVTLDGFPKGYLLIEFKFVAALLTSYVF
jgi:hypothetical protein